MWQLMFCVSVMCSALRHELQLTPQRRTHHRNTKHKLPHNNITVFINILNILSNVYKQLNEEVNE